jgi:hypothetical protein
MNLIIKKLDLRILYSKKSNIIYTMKFIVYIINIINSIKYNLYYEIHCLYH